MASKALNSQALNSQAFNSDALTSNIFRTVDILVGHKGEWIAWRGLSFSLITLTCSHHVKFLCSQQLPFYIVWIYLYIMIIFFCKKITHTHMRHINMTQSGWTLCSWTRDAWGIFWSWGRLSIQQLVVFKLQPLRRATTSWIPCSGKQRNNMILCQRTCSCYDRTWYFVNLKRYFGFKQTYDTCYVFFTEV